MLEARTRSVVKCFHRGVDGGYDLRRDAADEGTGAVLWSHRVSWSDLIIPIGVEEGRAGLDLAEGWSRRWSVSWKADQVLLALDFAGDLVDVVSQPLRIRFGTVGGSKPRDHTPDFLAVTRFGVWLIDVRPEPLMRDEDRESLAAAAEVALACGWHFVLVGRWREPVPSALDALSSQRRPLSDPLGLGRGFWPQPAGACRSASSPRPAGASRLPGHCCFT